MFRRRRRPRDNSWAEASNDHEHDDRYDRLLAVVCLFVSVGAFVAVPLFEPGYRATLSLLTVGVGGVVCAAAAYGMTTR